MAKANEEPIAQKKNPGSSGLVSRNEGAMELEIPNGKSQSVYLNIIDNQATIVPKDRCQPLKATASSSKQVSNYLDTVKVMANANSVIGPRNASVFLAAKAAQKSDSDEELNLLTDIKEKRDNPLYFINYDKPSQLDIQNTKDRLITKYGEVKTDSLFSTNLEVLNSNLVPILKSSKSEPEQFCKNLNVLLHYVFL